MTGAEMAAAGQIAQGASSMLSLPFDIYGGVQSLKLDRRKVREMEKDGRFGRLGKIVEMANALNQGASGRGRLYALRNAGASPASYNGQGMLPRA